MAAAIADVGFISTYLQLPENSIISALDSPTVKLVQAVLQAVAVKAHEHEEAQADKLRLEIELENAVRSSDTRAQGLKASVDKALQDANDLRIELNTEESTRSTLETELQQFKSSSTSSSAEVESLRVRISTLEATNRETVAVVESKSAANDSLAQELTKQHQKGLDLGQQIASLQQQLQNANSAVSSAKFRQQSTTQELEQAKRNNEWLDVELKNKSAEALKFRKEKGARIAELQRLNEEATANIEAMKKTETALRTRLEEVQKKAEESLSKMQQLEESSARAEESFRQELESSRRLADLRAQQTETHRNRLEEVESSLEKLKDDASKEINACQQEIESQRQEREQCENRIAELETEVDRLEALASQPQTYPGSAPGTPRPGTPRSSFNGPGRAGSPFATPGSVRSKSSITATQALEELYKVKGLLNTEKRRNERLTAEMEEMMQGLEAKQPELEEMQAEHGRLQQEIVEMSKFVDQSGKDMERAKKSARKAESDASTARAEAGILTQQLNDLSAQVRMLLMDMEIRDRGLETLSHEERRQMERLARGEVAEGSLEGLSDTDRLISERVVIFRSISDLQQKNQDLLKITRELGAQMESEEALAAKHQAAADHEEVQALQSKIAGYKDELQSMLTRSESYIKERDMFRRMLQHRGEFPPGNDMAAAFGKSVDANGMHPNVEQHTNNEGANAVAALRELQRHFDQYREEQSVDRRTLKEQGDRLATEKSTLQAEIARIHSQLTLANERYEMLQANYNMLQNENKELQKRSQVLSESAAKQDLRTQQVAEDLIESRGLVESMRNETANLKAEKKLWKEIQDRLGQDNENLMSERARLNGVIANQQTMQNERELSENETRRRLQIQVENLEKELSVTKRKYGDEVDESKKAQLRKEYDAQQIQKRIDDLVSNLGSIKEELAVAKNDRDHLQARVDELTIELKSAEERVDLLQPRPTPRPGTQGSGNAAAEGAADLEQALAIEVSELKRDLELTKGEVESAKTQMEHYKVISQAAEEDLQSFNETHEQYRQEMDGILEEKERKVQELHQRIEDISAELSSANAELNSLRDQQSEATRHLAEEKVALEAEIVRLRDDSERHSTAAHFHQQDLRAQAEIATKAQQDYEQELVKHAAAAQSLQTLRGDYNVIKTEVLEFKAEAESAKMTLSQSQSSWEERREQFEREINELRVRRDDMSAQNKILLQQMDDINAQIASLQHYRASADGLQPEGEAAITTDRSIEGLRELITYLRRDKEIVDVQYELSVQEGKRLRQQLDYTQSQLDETRLKLEQERRAQADGSTSVMAHKDLMEKLNELNLFRESSITLRNESRQAQAQLTEMTQRAEELLQQIQPLETKLREVENAKEMQDGEIRLLQEDRDRWQKRNQEILSKYDRIDPAEMEQLKQSIAVLQSERDVLLAEKEPIQEKITALEAEKITSAETRAKIIERAKKDRRELISERAAEREATTKEKEALEQQLSTVNQELEKITKEKQTSEQKLVSVQNDLASAKTEVTTQPPADLTPQLEAIRTELEKAVQEQNTLEHQLVAVKQELEAARLQKEQALAQVAQAAQEAQQAQEARTAAEASTAPVVTSGTNDDTDEGQIVEGGSSGLAESERKALEERITEAEARSAQANEKVKQLELSMDTTLKQRSEKMKAALNTKLTESRHAARMELEEEYKLKLEQERQIWLAENAAPPPAKSEAPAEASPMPPTPNLPPATPSKPAVTTAPIDLTKLSDAQVRDFLSSNVTVKEILASNIKKKVALEAQKLKDEFEKSAAEKLVEATKKAEEAKTQAVTMEGKKSHVRISMAENKVKTANYKVSLVEVAAMETPEKPIAQVWEVVKNAKPPVATPAVQPVATTTPSLAKPVVNPPIKTETPLVATPAPASITPANSSPQATNGASPTVPPSVPGQLNTQQVASAPQQRTGIPMPRGGGIPRGRGTYQGGPAGRGGNFQARGGGQMRGGVQQAGGRGGANLSGGAPSFSPTNGNKRPHDDSQNGGQQGQKRMRGGAGGS